MSVRDADLVENVLFWLTVRQRGAPLQVLEWGGGRSTACYTHFLAMVGAPYRWLTVEHDRDYFESAIAGPLQARPDASIVRAEDLGPSVAGRPASEQLLVVLFAMGRVRPDLPGHDSDRDVNLDDYVTLPARSGRRFDLAIVDGRKRRRCTLEAAGLLTPDGYVLIHDADRSYYQHAFSALRSGRRIGDDLWIGSNADTNFRDLLPPHAFDAAPQAAPHPD